MASEEDRYGPDRPRRGAFGRIWAAIPEWLRIAGSIGAVAALVWSARGLYDDQIATPAKVDMILDWKTEHEEWGEDKLLLLTGEDAALKAAIAHLQEQHDREIKQLRDATDSTLCKIIALQRGESMVGC